MTATSTGKRTTGLKGRSWLVIVAAVVAVLELGLAVARTGFYAGVGHQNLDAPKLLVRDADVDPLASFDATLAMVAAPQAIPRNATYTIVTGNERNVGMTSGFAIDVYRLWLMPRRYTTDLKKAQWALTYYRSSESLGVPYSEEIGLGPGVNAVKLGAPKGGGG